MAITARSESHVASLAPSARASVRASLDRAARIATDNAHADGVGYPMAPAAPGHASGD